MKRIILASIGLLVLVAAGIFLFNLLGGNNPIEIQVLENHPITLAGKTFEGTPQDKRLTETFKSIEDLHTLHPGTRIHTVYYKEPSGKLDTLRVFVGLDLPFAPEGLETLAFEQRNHLLAKITGSKWVMPGPEKVKNQLMDYAASNGMELSGVFIDKIVSESEVNVIAPIKPNL